MTNATLINKNNVSFIVKNIDEINISIDGIDEKTTDRVRGKGVFKKVLDTVNLLHEEDFGNIALSMVFGDKNYHLESKFIALNRRLGTRPVIRGFAEMGRGKENKDVFSTKEKMKNVDIIFDENNLQQEFTKSLSPCTCGAGKEKILVDYKGDIYPCQWFREVEDKMGNALEKNVSELHLTKAVRRVESFYPWKYPKCHECCVNYFCWPCPGELKEKAIDESFDIVEKWLKRTLDIFPNLRVRMTFNHKTVGTFFENIKYLGGIGVKYIVPARDFYDCKFGEKEFTILKRQLEKSKEYIASENKELHISLLEKFPFKKMGKCSGGIDSFHIDPEGVLYPCALSVGETDFAIGNVLSGIDKKNRDRLLTYSDKFNEACVGCDLYDFCEQTRCKIVNKLLTGEFCTPSPIVCAENHLLLELN